MSEVFLYKQVRDMQKKAEWYLENQIFLARLNPQWCMNVNVKG